MSLLLDTHVFLWYILADPRLSTQHRDMIRDLNRQVYLSVVSVWECMVKHQLGKLPLPQAAHLYLPEQRASHGILSLPVDEASVIHLDRLPLLHRDPFDRLLVCQALQHGLVLATVDPAIRAYPVPTI